MRMYSTGVLSGRVGLVTPSFMGVLNSDDFAEIEEAPSEHDLELLAEEEEAILAIAPKATKIKVGGIRS